MMDEEMIILQVEETEGTVDVENITLDIEQKETIEYIEVNEPEEISIEIKEAFGSPSVGDGNYASFNHTHTIDQIEELDGALHKLGSAKDYYSTHGGYAELRQWLKNGYYQTDDIYQGTGGIGYFVSLVAAESNIDGNNIYVDICKTDNADVYGVTVSNSGFYGYQDSSYDLLDPTTTNRANNPMYAKVCLLGDVKVRVTSEDHLSIKVGDFVVPNELGYAKKSENNIGFKVISKGQITGVGSTTTAWYYVDIALVPQNDNISRVMKELENTNVNINDVTLQIGDMYNKVDGMYNTTVDMSNKVNGFEGILNETAEKVDTKLPTIEQALQEAKDIADSAKKTINDVALEYSEAVKSANEAKDVLYGANGNGGVLSDIDGLKENMEPLAEWKGKNGTFGVAGFVSQADEDSTRLAALTEAFGENGSDITAIIQKIDENGAAIQHLVSHVDKYILGYASPINGLTLDEASFIQPGVIYVPTIDRTESYATESGSITVEFKYGKSYIWRINDTGVYMWEEYNDVFVFTDIVDFDYVELKKDDLWYCWQGVIRDDKYLYNPGTLYCWDGQIWVPVASANDGTSSVISLINQTAKKLTSTYTNLKGDMSLIEQDVAEIRSIVGSTESGSLSMIEQAAERIMMGTYNPDGSTSLGLLLDGMTSDSVKASVVKIKTVVEPPSSDAVKYDYAPTWNGKEFVQVGTPSTTGKYYFDPKDTAPFTYYCYAIDDSSYAVYGVNNVAMASINTRVTDVASEVESWTRFQKGQNETMTSINHTSDDAGAAISSMVFGDFRECVEINLELSDNHKLDFAADRYNEPPAWKIDKTNTTKKFIFETDPIYNGEYCLSITDASSYYKLLYSNEDVIGYEKYTINTQPYNAIVQKVEDGQSYIGLISGDDDQIGSVVINTINGKSEALISADKIGINGDTVFSSIFNNGTTTISGDYIRSGMLQSNDYVGSITYRKYGLKIENNEIVRGDDDDFVYFAVISKDVEYSDINVETSDGVTIDNIIEKEQGGRPEDYFEFDLNTGTILGLTSKGEGLTQLVIPTRINDCEITSIGDNAFKSCTNFTSVTISDGIESIGYRSFYQCTNLQSIIIQDSVASIGEEAFCGCTSLTSISVHDGVIDIGKNAFYNTGYYGNQLYWPGYTLYIGKNLIDSAGYDNVSYTIKSDTLNICDYAFSSRAGLTSITIPDSVVRIGNYAFASCNNLKNIVIPNSVVSVGYGVFSGCQYLNNVTLSDNLTEIGGGMFSNTRVISIDMPKNITKIGNYAFSRSYIQAIDLSNITHIGDYAFYSCERFKTLDNIPNIEYIGSYAFGDCENLQTITLKDGPINIGKCAFDNTYAMDYNSYIDGGLYIGCHLLQVKNNISSLTIKEGTIDIAEELFKDSAITNITFPSSFRKIPKGAFENCVSLNSIIINNGTTTIEDRAFYGCINLTSITIPDSVENIGDSVFYGAGLTAANLGSGLVSIGSHSFYDCSGLTSITIPNSVGQIGTEAFCNCSSLSTITIGSGVTNIDKDAFLQCNNIDSVCISSIASWCHILFGNEYSNPLSYANNFYVNNELLTDVVIPNDVDNIMDYAFYNCNSLKSAVIDDGIRNIGKYAFYSCGLISVEIPDSTVRIDDYAFNSCSSLESVYVGNGLTNIGDSAFGQCNNLKNVYISELERWLSINFDSVSSNPISYGADIYLNNVLLNDVVIPENITEIKSYVFYGCKNLNSVIITNNVESVGKYAFYECENLLSITIQGEILQIGTKAFNGTAYYNNADNWERGVLYIDKCLIGAKQYITSYSIPDGVLMIGDYVFANCDSLTSIVIPLSVKHIGDDAFDGCSNVTIECLYKSYAEAYAQTHQINYISNLGCYSCNAVDIGEELNPYMHESGVAKRSFYVVSENYFLIEPALEHTKGMLLNLNEGTIYSKNLILDKTGKLLITGDIQATGGYIGNQEYGLSIEYAHSGLIYKVREDVLQKGSYYFKEKTTTGTILSKAKYNYYKFKLLTDLHKGDVICCNFEDNYIYVNDIKHSAVISISEYDNTNGFTLIDFDEKTQMGYSLNNKQQSLKGMYGGSNPPDVFGDYSGVYIGSDGIGVGNGWLMLESNGTFNILDHAAMHISKNSNTEKYAFSMSLLEQLNQMAWTIYNPVTKVYDAAMTFDKSGYTESGINKYSGTFNFYYGINMHGNTISNQSDSRLKTNITDVDFCAVDILNQINLKSFDWIESGEHQDIGIIAQQLEEVLPSLVLTDEKTGLKSVCYIELISYLVKAVQELSSMVMPQMQLLSLCDDIETDTLWTDDMTYEEKQRFVQIERDSKSFYVPQHED